MQYILAAKKRTTQKSNLLRILRDAHTHTRTRITAISFNYTAEWETKGTWRMHAPRNNANPYKQSKYHIIPDICVYLWQATVASSTPPKPQPLPPPRVRLSYYSIVLLSLPKDTLARLEWLKYLRIRWSACRPQQLTSLWRNEQILSASLGKSFLAKQTIKDI